MFSNALFEVIKLLVEFYLLLDKITEVRIFFLLKSMNKKEKNCPGMKSKSFVVIFPWKQMKYDNIAIMSGDDGWMIYWRS